MSGKAMRVNNKREWFTEDVRSAVNDHAERLDKLMLLYDQMIGHYKPDHPEVWVGKGVVDDVKDQLIREFLTNPIVGPYGVVGDHSIEHVTSSGRVMKLYISGRFPIKGALAVCAALNWLEKHGG